MRHRPNLSVRERDGPRPKRRSLGALRDLRRCLLTGLQAAVWLSLCSQAGASDAWSGSKDSGVAPEYRGGLYLLPGSDSRADWQSGGDGSYGTVASGSAAGYGDAGSAGYTGGAGGTGYGGYSGGSAYGGDSGYGGYSGTSGAPGSSGYSGYSAPGYGGVPGQGGALRTGVYPTGPATLEQQYGVWGASGAQAPSWYSGGEGQPSAMSQYRFRDDPQLSKPQETELPKFRPYESQPGGAFSPSGTWPGLQGSNIAPAPVFRPLESDEHGGSRRSGSEGGAEERRYPGPATGYPAPLGYPLGYPGAGLPYSGGGWGYPAGVPWSLGAGSVWPGDGIWGALPPW